MSRGGEVTPVSSLVLCGFRISDGPLQGGNPRGAVSRLGPAGDIARL